MTTPEALNALADRVEREEPSRELDAEVLIACGHQATYRGRVMGWEYRPNRVGIWQSMPSPTTSLDAAVTLVPEGWEWLRKTRQTMTCYQPPANDKDWAVHLDATASTPAAALTAAALRARAADMQARAVPEPPPKVRSE